MGSCLSLDGPGSPAVARKGGKRRKAARATTGEERQANAAPGRMSCNGASSVASLFTRQGTKGTNQDAMIVWENFNARPDTVFCGVFDGHGPCGHHVARKVRDTLPLKLRDSLTAGDCGESPVRCSESTASEYVSSPCADEDTKLSSEARQNEKHSEMFTAPRESFLKAFKVVDKELKLHRNVDCFCSGTTAVTLIKQGQELIIGNLGDSRAILGTRDQSGCLIAHQLTVDLKPDLPGEAERIKQCKGRVFAHHDEPDVARIWLPNYNSPGLAMARAFGDFCLKDFGLISVPDVSCRRITEKDEFVVLATDGVWDVLSNQEVVDAVASAPAQSLAARSIVNLATRAWKFKYPTSKTDDCAVVCLFLRTDSTAGPQKDDANGLDPSAAGSISSPKMPCRSIIIRQSSKKVLQDDGNQAIRKDQTRSHVQESDDASDTTVDGDESSALEGFSRLDTLVSLPKFVAAEKLPKGTKK